MMIHPEGYYEMFLKGKTLQQLETEIRSLKRQINSLKKEIEEPAEDNEIEMYPSPLTILKMNKEYLAYAIKAYEESGGVYTPTKAEQKAIDFDQELEYLDKLIFNMCGFFSGYETRTYTVSGDVVKLQIDSTFSENDSCNSDNSYTKNEFIEALQKIHIGEWKKEYYPSTVIIMDGTQWELEIQFNNNHKPVKKSGSNAYPYNFNELTELLGIE